MAAPKKAPAAKKKVAAKKVDPGQGPLVMALTVIFALLSAVFVWLAYRTYGM